MQGNVCHTVRSPIQGCQMVYFYTKNFFIQKILNWEIVEGLGAKNVGKFHAPLENFTVISFI
jgi:hypothetical protein